MDMKKYLAALQAKEATQQAPLCNDANTVLELLYNTYYEQDDTDEIKQAFDDLYHSMTGKILKEKNEIINAVCNLCRLHQQSGFVDGLKLATRLSHELNN